MTINYGKIWVCSPCQEYFILETENPNRNIKDSLLVLDMITEIHQNKQNKIINNFAETLEMTNHRLRMIDGTPKESTE